MRYWQVFGNDKQIESFLQSKYEFENSNIDLEDGLDSQIDVHISIEKLFASDVNILANKIIHEIEIHKDPEKKEFKVLQLKDSILPIGLAPLE